MKWAHGTLGFVRPRFATVSTPTLLMLTVLMGWQCGHHPVQGSEGATPATSAAGPRHLELPELNRLILESDWFGFFGQHSTWIMILSGPATTERGEMRVLHLFANSRHLEIAPTIATSAVECTSEEPIVLYFTSIDPLSTSLTIRPIAGKNWGTVSNREDVVVTGDQLLLDAE